MVQGGECLASALVTGMEVQACERMWDQKGGQGEGLRLGGRSVPRTESEEEPWEMLRGRVRRSRRKEEDAWAVGC